MMTRAQAKRQRRELMKDIAREHRKKQRDELRTLKHAIRDARDMRRSAIVRAKEMCRQGRIDARQRARELRARLLEDVRLAVKAERQAAQQTCSAATGEASTASTELQRRRAALKAERQYRRDMKRIERGNRKKFEQAERAHKAARRGESDDEVRGNIPPELVPLFERVKGKVRGSERWSRTEAFLHYAEEHPDEVLGVLEDRTEALIAELEAKERAGRRALARPVPRHVYADVVPF